MSPKPTQKKESNEPLGTKRRDYFKRRLATRLLVLITVASVILVSLAATASFWVSYNAEKRQLINRLVTDSTARVTREESAFAQAETTATILAQAFKEDYARLAERDDLVSDFDNWHVESETNVFRLKPEFFSGTIKDDQRFRGLSAFIGRPPGDSSRAGRSAELKARIVIAERLLQRFGPGWANHYENTHISMPENVLALYSEHSAWGSLARADLDITEHEVVRSTLQSENPERHGDWTGLYYDLSAEQWVITYQLPVDLDGRHLGSASHDVLLTSVLERLVASENSAVSHLVFNRQEQLIASPNWVAQAHQEQGVLKLRELENTNYLTIYQRIEAEAQTHDDESFVIQDDTLDQLMVVTHISQPDWWHVTLYPYENIQKAALQQPLRVVFVGFMLVFMVLIIVYWSINRYVSKPIYQLASLANLVGEQKYFEVTQKQLGTETHASEIGLLARSLRDMAERILNHKLQLESQVEERTHELAQANAQLNAIAHLDGLTGLKNRRAFDRDIQTAMTDSSAATALVLADIDYFKDYNDTYGHQLGDKVLQDIAKCLQKIFPDKIYRYGGEEIAALVPAVDLATAQHCAEQLRAAIEALQIEHTASVTPYITASFGVVLLDPERSVKEQLGEADALLYKAKKAGRNCVC